MNMPNRAWCHQAIRCARVAASAVSMGEATCGAVDAIASLFAALRAKAPAAPICFKNDRLELSLHSIVLLPRRAFLISQAGAPEPVLSLSKDLDFETWDQSPNRLSYRGKYNSRGICREW
jgi:hypothetical protein